MVIHFFFLFLGGGAGTHKNSCSGEISSAAWQKDFDQHQPKPCVCCQIFVGVNKLQTDTIVAGRNTLYKFESLLKGVLNRFCVLKNNKYRVNKSTAKVINAKSICPDFSLQKGKNKNNYIHIDPHLFKCLTCMDLSYSANNQSLQQA